LGMNLSAVSAHETGMILKRTGILRKATPLDFLMLIISVPELIMWTWSQVSPNRVVPRPMIPANTRLQSSPHHWMIQLFRF